MDTLKEKLFEITVGAAGVILLALAFFLVVQPLQTLGELQTTMDQKTKDLRRRAQASPIPTGLYVKMLTGRKQQSEQVLKNAEAFYKEQGTTYRTYFGGRQDRPELNVFVSSYKDAVDKLVADYRTQFGIQEDPDQPDQTPPRVKTEEYIQTVEGIDKAMEQYWILQELFAAVTAGDIDGLRMVDFPPPEEKEEPPYWKWQIVQAELWMKFSKVENLLTRLYDSDVVPFILMELSYTKNSEQLTPFVPLERSVEYEDPNLARLLDYEKIVPEPEVVVTLRLKALHWKGIPQETAETAETVER